MPTDTPRGLTVSDIAQRLRVGEDKIRTWIRSGKLKAINTAEPLARPRYVVLPETLEEFVCARTVAPPPPTPKRRRRQQPATKDYFPDD